MPGTLREEPLRSKTPIILRQSRNYCDFSALGRVPMRGMVVYHLDVGGTPTLGANLETIAGLAPELHVDPEGTSHLKAKSGLIARGGVA